MTSRDERYLAALLARAATVKMRVDKRASHAEARRIAKNTRAMGFRMLWRTIRRDGTFRASGRTYRLNYHIGSLVGGAWVQITTNAGSCDKTAWIYAGERAQRPDTYVSAGESICSAKIVAR